MEATCQPTLAGSKQQASPIAAQRSGTGTASSGGSHSAGSGNGINIGGGGPGSQGSAAKALGLVPGGKPGRAPQHHVSVPGVPLRPKDANKVIRGEELQDEVWLRAEMHKREKLKRQREQQLAAQHDKGAVVGATKQAQGGGPNVTRYSTPSDQLEYVHQHVVRASQSGAQVEDAAARGACKPCRYGSWRMRSRAWCAQAS